jgi:hypothetical protein
MKSAKKFLWTAVLLNFFVVNGALADTIFLKNGKKLEVDKTWREGAQLCFNFHGIKAGIPQSKVSRVKRNPDVDEIILSDSYQNKDDSKKSDLESPQAIHQSPPKPRPEPCSALRKDGFCDLQWGRKLASVDGLQKKQTISDLDGVVEYIRPSDPTNIENANLKSVIYAFWREQLYTVTIWTEGRSNYTALREAVFKLFGPGIRSDATRERYLWSNDLSDIMLDYTKDGQYGMLWLRSKELDHQCRSSRLKSHASLLKWMKSRN